MLVKVIGKSGRPLMPCNRNGHIRWLLKTNKAKVVTTKPFTIQLLYETPEITQPPAEETDQGQANNREASPLPSSAEQT